jgi:hypothetical protein
MMKKAFVNPKSMSIATMILFLIVSHSRAQELLFHSSIRAEYEAFRERVDSIGVVLNLYLKTGDRNQVTDHFAMINGSQIPSLIKWIDRQKEKYGAFDNHDISLFMPPLGVDGESGYSGPGYIRFNYTNSLESKYEEIQLPPLRIPSNGKPDFIVAKDEEKPLIKKEISITEAYFNVEPKENGRISVTAEYKVRSISDGPLSIIRFVIMNPCDFKSVSIEGKEVSGNVKYSILQGTPCCIMAIKLPETLRSHGDISLKFAYETDFHYHQLGRKPVGFTGNRGFVLPETSWYPRTMPQMNEQMDFTIDISVPAGNLASAAGSLVKKWDSDDRTVFRYHEEDNAPYFIWGSYVVKEQKAPGLEIEYWLPAESDITEVHLSAVVNKVCQTYSELLPSSGNNNPQRIIAVTRFGGYGAVGNLLLNDEYFKAESCKNLNSNVLVAHELAHTWINSRTMPGGEFKNFLNEGLAVYFSNICFEGEVSDEDILALWETSLKNYSDVAYRAVAPCFLSDSIMLNDNEMYRAVAYDKAAYLLREVEFVLGRKKLISRLNNLFESKEDRVFTWADFRGYVSGRNQKLTKYLDQYVMTNNHPDLSFESSTQGVSLKVSGFKGEFPYGIPVRVSNPEGSKQLDLKMREQYRIKIDSNYSDGYSLIADPERRILQTQIMNDVYPKAYFSVADNNSIESMLSESFLSLFTINREASIGNLASDPDNIDPRQREALLEQLNAKMNFRVTEISGMDIVRITDTTGVVRIYLQLKVREDIHNTIANVHIVKENNLWKYKSLGIKTIGFKLE